MKALLKIIFVLTVSMQIQSQERIITGKVTAADDNSPIPGANVLIKGTSTGVTTTFDGLYEIKAKDTDVLVFSFIGYKTEEKLVGKLNTISVVLQEDVSRLEEVVVAGYGIRKKSYITTASISTESSKSISKTISGKVSGVSLKKQEPQSGQLTAAEINDLKKWYEWENLFKNTEYKDVRDKWGF